MTSGDYDGDGYPDLAVSSSASTGVWVLRGSEYGLIAPTAYTDIYGLNETLETSTGPGHQSFPYISGNSAGMTQQLTNPTNYIVRPVRADGWADGTGFGASLGTIHNGYYDYISSSIKNTQRIRDVLLIGNPNYAQTAAGDNRIGRVFACLPKTVSNGAAFADDSAQNLAWDCNHFIDPPKYALASPTPNPNASGVPVPTTLSAPSVNSTVSGFGAAMASLSNPLRYRPNSFHYDPACTLNGNTSPVPFDFGNCYSDSASTNLGLPGGVAIGAPFANRAFIYYGVSNSDGSTTTRDSLGLARNTYLNTLFTKNTAVKDSPCSGSGSTETCEIQLLTQPSTASGYFGTTLSALRGNNSDDNDSNPKETLLAVSAPYKDIAKGSSIFTAVGSVQLFQQSSHFNNDPIVVGPPGSTVNRYSTGFSNTLTSSLDYDGPLDNQIHFGLGGVAAGPIVATAPDLGSRLSYSDNSDIVVGAPGAVKIQDANKNTIPTVYDNGAALVYFSQGGSFSKYPYPNWHMIDSIVNSNGTGTTAIGQESDVRFHEAISIGDLDHDGIGDIAVRMARGSARNTTRIYSGKSCSSSISASGVPCIPGLGSVQLDFTVSGDNSAGYRFIPTGAVSGGTYGAYFITGLTSSYLYFSGTSGIITGVPSNVGSPRKLSSVDRNATPPMKVDGATPSGASYIKFSDSTFYNAEGTDISTTLSSYANFAYGDFNGDGIMDFAFAQNSSDAIIDTDATAGATLCPSIGGVNTCLSSTTTTSANKVGAGRVMIFYGGASNGFKVQADGNGGYPLQYDYLGADGNSYGVTTLSKSAQSNIKGDPCNSTTGVCNRIQVIAEQNTVSFGKSIAAIPFGTCNGKPLSALAVRAELASDSKIYVYPPRCASQSGNLGGLAVNGGTSAIEITASSNLGLSGVSASTTLGLGLTGASTRLMGPDAPNTLLSYIVATDQTNRRVFVLPISASNHQIFSPATALNTPPSNTTTDPFYLNGGRILNYSTSNFMLDTSGNPISGVNSGFGEGVAVLGDINGDGYDDIGINIPRLNRIETSNTFAAQGGSMILFGGISGLQTHAQSTFSLMQPSASADCYTQKVTLAAGDRVVSYCNPTFLFAPQPTTSSRQGIYEQTFLSPFSAVSTGATDPVTKACTLSVSPNECLGSFLFGVPGRDSIELDPSQKPILQGGVFYVVP